MAQTSYVEVDGREFGVRRQMDLGGFLRSEVEEFEAELAAGTTERGEVLVGAWEGAVREQATRLVTALWAIFRARVYAEGRAHAKREAERERIVSAHRAARPDLYRFPSPTHGVVGRMG